MLCYVMLRYHNRGQICVLSNKLDLCCITYVSVVLGYIVLITNQNARTLTRSESIFSSCYFWVLKYFNKETEHKVSVNQLVTRKFQRCRRNEF